MCVRSHRAARHQSAHRQSPHEEARRRRPAHARAEGPLGPLLRRPVSLCRTPRVPRHRLNLTTGREAPMTARLSVLFVCVHNAGRSQTAAGWLRELAGNCIDITRQKPKTLTPEPVQPSDVVITMGCGDACPYYPGKRYKDVKLEDPAGKGVAEVRSARHEIRT